jgi:uncharacterized membrane protein
MARRLRKLLREPYWLALVLCGAAGLVLGNTLAHEATDEATHTLFLGRAWRGDARETRALLAGLLGFQITVLTIVLSLNGSVMQSAANQYSPRLAPLYLRHAPLRRALPLFVLCGGYLLAAIRELGLVASDATRPRIVVSVAILLLLSALILLTVEMIRTVGFMRVERVLGMVRSTAFTAIDRVRRRLARHALDPKATLELPVDATALTAPQSGYLADFDLPRLMRTARKGAVRVRIWRAIGDYVDQGEIVGWVARDSERDVDRALLDRLASSLVVTAARERDYDPALGMRILVDVAARALSSSVNDPYTARQALAQLRSILRQLVVLPLGDWNLVDSDGTVRVSVRALRFREYLSLAVDGPLRCGAHDPETLEGILEIALEVGLVAREAEDRAAGVALLDRVIDDAAQYGGLDRSRLQRLRAEADLVRAALEMNGPRPERFARSEWALAMSDSVAPHDRH